MDAGIIDAILLNNPFAVSDKLAALGLIRNDGEYSPEDLKMVIHQRVAELPDEDGTDFALQILDVPIDLSGDQADYLLEYHVQNGNRMALQQELQRAGAPERYTGGPLAQMKVQGWPLPDVAVAMGLVFMIVLIIALIKKI